jgi:hypothetical protein
MVKIQWNPLVTETAQRLYGLSALIEMIGRAAPEVELQERGALKELAEKGNWDFSDYREKCAFDPNNLNGSVLEKVALYINKVSGLQLTENARWQLLKDLQELRNIIVHRAGKPPEDQSKRSRLEQMVKRYRISVLENPYAMNAHSQLDISIYTCKSFAGEIEAFFKGIFKDDGLPVETGLWPNIENRFT